MFQSRSRHEKRKVDWAINSGVKNDKTICDFFDKNEGACFIPYDKLTNDIQVKILRHFNYVINYVMV